MTLILKAEVITIDININNNIIINIIIIIIIIITIIISNKQVKVIVAPSKQVSPPIIRRTISASFSAPQISPKSLPQNPPDFDRRIDLDPGADISVEEPQNFEQLMLKITW